LVAAFFGEYNFIEPFGFIYAHQLQIVEKSNFEAQVKDCYFNGKNYLIEAVYQSKSIFIEHSTRLNSGTVIYLEVRA
jgi:hypothetical protein